MGRRGDLTTGCIIWERSFYLFILFVSFINLHFLHFGPILVSRRQVIRWEKIISKELSFNVFLYFYSPTKSRKNSCICFCNTPFTDVPYIDNLQRSGGKSALLALLVVNRRRSNIVSSRLGYTTSKVQFFYQIITILKQFVEEKILRHMNVLRW